ncbi:hypothetical protein HD554DRAFT_2298655 [Boletus coccyginus]|nr:hypothetical protein HD554DRAFT_2298655 [Boletus coccyginus]
MGKQASPPPQTSPPPTLIQPFQGRRASFLIHIVFVGCGLNGLSAAWCLAKAGNSVTILESRAAAIGEIGAGIQISPNVSRLLIRWGLGDKLKQVAVKPVAFTFRRWSTGETITWTKFGESMDEEYGAPYYHIHRADFHRILYELAKRYPRITVRTSCRVVAMDPSIPTFTLESGEVVRADLVIGADGVKSLTREYVVGGPDKPTPTGDAAYRAIIPTDLLLKDPDLRPLVETPELVGWIGPGRHIVAYNIEYNILLLHPDDGSVDSWTLEGSADKMRADFVGWEPRCGDIQKLLALVPSTLKWRLTDRTPLSTWVHRDGKLALLGDSCHPVLVEDAAVLGNLFSHLSSRAQITPLLRAYESIRFARAVATQASSRPNQYIFHLPDGPEQEGRDRQMRAAMEVALSEAGDDVRRRVESAGADADPLNHDNANQWVDKAKSWVQFGYDADVESEKWWAEHGQRAIGVVARRRGRRRQCRH